MDLSTNTSVSDPALATYLEQVEKDLLDHVLEALKEKKIPAEEAQKLAQDFLKELPPHDKADLLGKLQELSQLHPAARDTFLKFANEAHTLDRDQKLKQAAHHISQGDIDSALSVVKGEQHAA